MSSISSILKEDFNQLITLKSLYNFLNKPTEEKKGILIKTAAVALAALFITASTFGLIAAVLPIAPIAAIAVGGLTFAHLCRVNCPG